jgi:hypothetical protein
VDVVPAKVTEENKQNKDILFKIFKKEMAIVKNFQTL